MRGPQKWHKEGRQGFQKQLVWIWSRHAHARELRPSNPGRVGGALKYKVGVVEIRSYLGRRSRQLQITSDGPSKGMNRLGMPREYNVRTTTEHSEPSRCASGLCIGIKHDIQRLS